MRWIFLMLASYVAASAAVLGIDLGTDSVKASLVGPNAPFELVLTPDTARKDASGLVIKPGDGERVYGSPGLALAAKFPAESLYTTKQLLGVPFDDFKVSLYRILFPGPKLVKTDRNTIAFEVNGEAIPVEEVVAMQLRELATRGELVLRDKMNSKTERLTQIALSVPSYFGSGVREAYYDAARLAGLEIVSLVDDGVAVAINYANQPSVLSKLGSEETDVVVFDAGAGAVKVTLVGIQKQGEGVAIKVKAHAADVGLSGQALTSNVRELLLQKFEKKTGVEVQRTPRLMNRMWREAERAKQVLSANTETHVFVEGLVGDTDLSAKLSREDLENNSKYQRDLVAKTLDAALANYTGEVQAVVLAGGATRTPFVLEELASYFGEEKLSKNVNADEAIVQGTAMRGVAVSGLYKAKRTFDVADVSTKEYKVHVYSDSEERITHDLFSERSELGAQAAVPLPKDVSKLELVEGVRKLTTWNFPYLAKNLESLDEPGVYTCVGAPTLKATFTLSEQGIVGLKQVDAVCDARLTSSTTAAPSSAVSETGEKTEDATATETETASASATQVYPKSRRITVLPHYDQTKPLGHAEQSSIRAHLVAMDKKDAERLEVSTLSHQLESLAYRLRGLLSEGDADLHSIADSALDFLETGDFHIDELKKRLAEAHEVVAAKTREVEQAEDTRADIDRVKAEDDEAEDDEAEEDEADDVEDADEDPEHDEL